MTKLVDLPPLLLGLAIFSASLAAPRETDAGGLRILHFPPVQPAPQKMTIDGKPDEWKSIDAYTLQPEGTELGITRSGGIPEVESLLKNPVTVSLKVCYDTDAFYVLAQWKDAAPGTNQTPASDAANWDQGGEGLELHVGTDRILHLACWPTRDKTLAVMSRYDNDARWKNAANEIQATGRAGENGDGTYVQEIRIPWSALTRDGKMPADGKLQLAADFAWNSINDEMMALLRKSALATNNSFRGTSFCFLSARVPAVGTASLQNVSEWGGMAAGAMPTGDRALVTPAQTSLAEMPLPLAKTVPALDGTLAGWDPASFQTAASLPAYLGSRFTCRLAASYDAGNFYLAAHFLATGKFGNIEPERTQQGFIGGDALQVRLGNGSKKINVCGWFDTTAGKPALTADGKDLNNAFLLPQGAREVFKADADGHGYVQELAVPWSLLFGGAPKDGDHLKATFQAWFADQNPRFSVFTDLVLQRQGAIQVAYKMPADGQITLGLFDRAGKLLKWLVQDEFRSAGDHQQAWNGLDQWGQPVAAADYTLKAAYHPPLSLDYKMTVGNPGNPPWPTPDDKGDWLCDEAPPQAVATDGKWVFVGSPGNEKGFSILGLDETGQRQWSLTEPFNPRSVSLTLAGDYLYILYSGPEITDTDFMYSRAKNNAIGRAILVCVDKKTGKPAKFTRESPHLRVATWPYREARSFLWDLRNNKSFSPFNYGGQPRYFCTDIGESTNALGIASVGNKLYLSLSYENKLLVLDRETGKPSGEEIPIDSPAGLCALDDHTLLAVSGTKVVKVDVGTRVVTSYLTADLVAPDSIALDRSGNVYVSDWGTSFEVKAFASSGKLLHAVGIPGGRPWIGKWDPHGMLVPRGIAVTDEDKLWVAEDDGSPKRISVWNAQSGAFLKDYIGPLPYGGGTHFWMDPKDPTLVHVEGTRFKVDFDKKTYTPEAIDFRQIDQTDPFAPNGHDLDGYQVRILYHGGHEYAVATTNGRKTFSILQRQGDLYRSVAGFASFPWDSKRALTPDSDSIHVWDSDIMHHLYEHYFPPFFAGHMTDNCSWTDTNGDNRIQPEEMHWVKTASDRPYHGGAQGVIHRNWGLDISPEWSFFFPAQFKDKIAIMRLDLKGWTPAGAPIYDIADAKAIILMPRDHAINSLHVTNDKKLIVAYDFEWSNEKAPNAIECYDLDGHFLWGSAMPKLLAGKNVHANCVAYDYNVPGIGDVVCTWLYHGSQKPFFFTTDGLYIGTALDDTLLGPTAIWSESARYFYQSPDGTPYIVNGANQQAHIFQINGLQKGGRFEQPFSLNDAEIAKAASMRTVPEEKVAPRPDIQVVSLPHQPQIDGDFSDWNLATGVTMDGGNKRSAEVALGHDQENLYLAYKVHEPTPPLVNSGGDWHSLFITGDCVDLMLQTDPKADPHRRGAVAGDERLLFSVYEGKPIAVLYKPVVPGTTSPIHLASAQIDQIIKLDSAKIAVQRDAERGTYSVEVAVPFKDLSIDPKQADTLRGDVGVIFADESGRNRALRLYYYNKHTEMIADLPTESTLQPSEWGPLQFR